MNGHTPGPWRFVDGAIYAQERGAVHRGRTCLECGHDPFECGDAVVSPIDDAILADVKAGFWDGCDAPNPADMRLMAAAPELLEACRLARHICEDGNALQQQIDAAIAKATAGLAP